MSAIDSFSGDFDFLSNFYPSKVEFEEMEFPTVEHAFQAAKTKDLAARIKIANAGTPGKAKQMGRQVTLRPDWDTARLQVMEDLLRQKFSDPDLKQFLLATGDVPLIEGNTWGDKFWGVCDGEGKNNLGKLLMKIRSEQKVLRQPH